MVRVTDYYNLGATQSGVDFVDVDVYADVPVFIDPAAIRRQTGNWADACVLSLQTYFASLLKAIRASDTLGIRSLIVPLNEPNETHLGLSAGRSRGRSLGSEAKARELIDSLRASKAARSGHLKDLEDTALMVEGIGRDIISDMTTCIIRSQLIAYTQAEAKFHGIPLESQVSGPMWNSVTSSWEDDTFVDLPRAGSDKLMLVPKSIVRATMALDQGRYYRGFLRPYFEAEELNDPGSNLVQVLRSKRRNGPTRRKVMKGKLDEKIGTSKPAISDNTEKYPAALDDYRAAIAKQSNPPMPDERIRELIGTSAEKLTEMLDEISAITPGQAGANSYHRAIAKLLTAIFDTQLGNEHIERELHNGLKRIDITYDNISGFGFFDWLRKNYPSALVVVECKNYGKEVGNPEFDQLAMRFSPQRGQVGLLVCRSVEDADRAAARAKAAADDGHGFIIVLTDDDLATIVADIVAAGDSQSKRMEFPLLRKRFNALIGA